LACAARAGCDVLLAWDGPFAAIGTYKSVRIEEPTIYDRTLFTENEIATPEEIRTYAISLGSLKLGQTHAKKSISKETKSGSAIH
jgi:hypothetical protein